MKRETDEWVWRRSVSERPNVLMDDNRTCVRGGVHVWMYIRFHFPFFFFGLVSLSSFALQFCRG